jgi:hypothetical protein
MRTRAFAAVVSLFAVSGALGLACSSTTTEDVACDPASDPSCASADGGGGDALANDGGVDGTVADGTVPDTGSPPPVDGAPPDGITVLPDGSVILPDGAVRLPDGAVLTDAGAYPCVPGGTQCTNCVDDDGDGLVDWLDPECTGPLDRDEGSFATGIPGDNKDPCKQDCWFDGNSGSGDDGCLFPGECLPGSTDPKCPYDPVAAADPAKCPTPSKACMDYCKPLTPKGCDCAGCCDVFDAAGKVYTVKLVSTCTTEALSDPTKCPTCSKIADCSNPCGKCDWCLGKTSLPPECYPPPPDAGVTDTGTPPLDDAGMPIDTGTPPPPVDSGPPPSTCPAGYTPCSPTLPCATGFYCLTGCCIKPPG